MLSLAVPLQRCRRTRDIKGIPNSTALTLPALLLGTAVLWVQGLGLSLDVSLQRCRQTHDIKGIPNSTTLTLPALLLGTAVLWVRDCSCAHPP